MAERRPLRCLPLLLLAACAATPPAAPELEITGVRFANRGGGWVSAVRILVPATGEFVSCGNIGPGNECATRFPERVYSGNPVEVTWSQGGQIWSTGEIELERGEALADVRKALVQVVITGPGSAGVGLLPDSGP